MSSNSSNSSNNGTYNILYMFCLTVFIVFLTIVSNYIRLNETQSEYIRNNKWTTDLAVFLVAFMALELAEPTLQNIAYKIIFSISALVIYKMVTK